MKDGCVEAVRLELAEETSTGALFAGHVTPESTTARAQLARCAESAKQKAKDFERQSVEYRAEMEK